MTYSPKPIDTSGITPTPEICALLDRLAANVHDLWAARRIADGWTYGKHRDDFARRHPCLVPYEELPDEEKEYDRQTVMGTLKAVLAQLDNRL